MTIRKIAERTGFSVGTISNVINGTGNVKPSNRERILKAIEELDYHPNRVARSLKTGKTGVLAIIVPDIGNPFFPLIVRGAESFVTARDFILTIFNTDDRVELERRFLRELRRRRVDGVLIVVAADSHDSRHVLKFARAGIPVVCVDRLALSATLDTVVTDSLQGTVNCVDHLIERGHERIGLITGPLNLETARERFDGYKLALRKAQLPFDQALVKEGNFRRASGRQQMLRLLSLDQPPSAVFISNNMMAFGALETLESHKMIYPDDIAVATFDELPFQMRPDLISVVQPAREMGRRAAEILVQRMGEGNSVPENPRLVRLPAGIRYRGSSDRMANAVDSSTG
jgi:LacI family transcriptional regulator